MSNSEGPDLVLHQGRFATLDRSNPDATAVAIKDGRFVQVGRESDILPLADRETQKPNWSGGRERPAAIYAAWEPERRTPATLSKERRLPLCMRTPHPCHKRRSGSSRCP